MTVLQRTNLAPAPRPGFNPAAWPLPGTSTSDIRHTIGWEGDTVPVFLWHWPAGTSSTDTLTTPLPGLVAGRRYTWFVAVAPENATPRQISVMGNAPVTLAAFTWFLLTGSFVATGADQFTIAIAGAYPSGAGLFVDTLLIEDRPSGSSSRYFDGDLPGATWAGAPWRSTSRFTYDMDPVTLEPLSPFPMAVVELAARPPQDWEFIVGRSLIGGSDLLPETPRWWPMPHVKQIEIRRGRKDDLSSVQTGECTVTFDNFDGMLDPDNAASPYRPNPAGWYIEKGCMLRVVSLGVSNALQFTVSPLFTGRLDDADLDKTWSLRASMHAVDDLALLGTTSIPSYSTPVRDGDTTGQRLAWVCDQAGVTSVISVGATRALLALSGGGSARGVADDAVNAEGGRLFCDVHGQVVATVHGDEYKKKPAVKITDQGDVAGSTQANVDYEQITVSNGTGTIINQATVDRGQTAPSDQSVTAADLDSIADHGVQSVTVSAPLANENEALQLAEFLAYRRSQRLTQVTGLVVNLAGQKPIWAQQCARLELGTHVEVARLVKYTSATVLLDRLYSVEGVTHSLTPQSWTASFAFAPAAGLGLYGTDGPFLIGSSHLGSADVLTPY